MERQFFIRYPKPAFINILSKNELKKIINENEAIIDDYINIVFLDKNESKH